MVLVELALP